MAHAASAFATVGLEGFSPPRPPPKPPRGRPAGADGVDVVAPATDVVDVGAVGRVTPLSCRQLRYAANVALLNPPAKPPPPPKPPAGSLDRHACWAAVNCAWVTPGGSVRGVKDRGGPLVGALLVLGVPPAAVVELSPPAPPPRRPKPPVRALAGMPLDVMQEVYAAKLAPPLAAVVLVVDVDEVAVLVVPPPHAASTTVSAATPPTKADREWRGSQVGWRRRGTVGSEASLPEGVM